MFLSALFGFFIAKGDDLMPPTPEWFKWFVLINFIAMIAIVVSTLAFVAGIDSWASA